MSFLSLIARNLVRQRTRALLTVLGIGIGSTTVVALGSITQGMKATSEDLLRAGGADFMVAQKGAADLSFSTISLRDWRAVELEPGIERAWGVLMHVSRVGSNPVFFTYGLHPEDMPAAVPKLDAGTLPRGPRELALGAGAADSLDVGLGGTVTIDRTAFRVSGIYRSGSLLEEVRAGKGMTLLLVTHDASVAARADRIVRMLDGRAVGEERPAQEIHTTAGGER